MYFPSPIGTAFISTTITSTGPRSIAAGFARVLFYLPRTFPLVVLAGTAIIVVIDHDRIYDCRVEDGH